MPNPTPSTMLGHADEFYGEDTEIDDLPRHFRDEFDVVEFVFL
jgi:hypothetical protein